MQYGILDGQIEQKKVVSGRTGEILIRSVVNSNVSTLIAWF